MLGFMAPGERQETYSMLLSSTEEESEHPESHRASESSRLALAAEAWSQSSLEQWPGPRVHV